MIRLSHTNRSLLALALLGFAAACTSEKIVYRGGVNFASPPTAGANFIGYYDVASKATVCGSCHADYQVRWAQTKHASAWSDLQATGAAATGVCSACHTVNNLGNAAADTAVGYRSTKDARYHDVQCESCHGTGLPHAAAPASSNHPLASIAVDTGVTSTCSGCHTGEHTPFVDEWKQKNVKGLSHSIVQSGTVGNTDPTCVGCHTVQGALNKWGINEAYKEQVATSAINSTNALPLVCATCHDPHGSPNDHQLRFSIRAATVDDNLCIQCHQRRADPSQVTTRNSVHSPEGPTLLGLAGWFPPGISAGDSIIGTHGTPSRNPTLCATCHVFRYTATDASGSFVQQVAGHRFIAAPCIDASGIPTSDQTCALPAKTFRSCVSGACHASETVARSLYTTDSLRIYQLIGQANSTVTKATALSATNCKLGGASYTTCLGTQFNVSLASSPGAFVHNPFLLEQLLVTSISQMQKDYGVVPDGPPVSMQTQLAPPPGWHKKAATPQR